MSSTVYIVVMLGSAWKRHLWATCISRRHRKETAEKELSSALFSKFAVVIAC